MRRHLLIKVLNSALGLDLADFTEARVFLRSSEGDALLEDWLVAHRNDPDDGENADTTERTTA